MDPSSNAAVAALARAAPVAPLAQAHVPTRAPLRRAPLQVRSCSLDTWLPEQVEFMARTGNALGNAYWEAALPAGLWAKKFATLQGEAAQPPAPWRRPGRAAACFALAPADMVLFADAGCSFTVA